MHFSTKAIHAGQEPDPTTGAIMTPVYFTSTYVQEAPGQHKGYVYARGGNPTRSALEQNIAALENGAFGLCFSSGMAAENAIMHLLKPGDHVLAARDLYGGTFRMFRRIWENWNLQFTYVDATDLQTMRQAVRDNTKLIWIETPSNPQLSIVDIAKTVEMARSIGARVVVDNTFASPCLQQPLALGADLVIHSTTKYLGGHSDVVGGAIVTDDQQLHEQLKFVQNAIGGVPGPMDCFLVLRGIKTLQVRMQRHSENAMAIAEFLQAQPDVKFVAYPGLKSHPGYEIAKRQMSSFGGMVSFELNDSFERHRRFVSLTKVFSLAESLGGVESLVCQPAAMTHASVPADQRTAGGLTDSLIRLSVGIEHVDDLIEDLSQALQASQGSRAAALA